VNTILGLVHWHATQLLLDQSVRIGDTANIIGIYQLLAVLRVIGKWIDTTFRTWLSDFLDGVQAAWLNPVICSSGVLVSRSKDWHELLPTFHPEILFDCDSSVVETEAIEVKRCLSDLWYTRLHNWNAYILIVCPIFSKRGNSLLLIGFALYPVHLLTWIDMNVYDPLRLIWDLQS
jgi:hypothetical protein